MAGNVLGLNGSEHNVASARQKMSDMKKMNAGEIGAPPAWLDARMKKMWKAVVKHYESTPVLCELDRTALASLCVSSVKLTEIDQLITASESVDDQKALLKLKKDYMSDFKALSTLFGLSPKDRANLSQAISDANIELEKSDPLLEALGDI